MGGILIMWFTLIFLIISVALAMVSYLFFYNPRDLAGLDPFECGIDPLTEIKTPFYMHFFYVSIIFLIFDVELAICIPSILSSISENLWNVYWMSFWTILLAGLCLEVMLDSLDWKD